MLSILRHRVYRHLFAAQVISLLGTGMATVALSLMAFELAGDNAGTVLATALTIKMLAYVFVSPLLAALFQGRPRKPVLVLLDIIRALTALSLPFLTEVWHIYVVIFVLQSSSSGFTPLFQATIPDVLPDEREYTKALSLSRLAYDMESLISPMLAAALLLITSWHGLFFGTMLGFVASALLVLSVILPKAQASAANTWTDRLTKGGRIYLLTPRLRGLLLLSFTTALGGAMVFVNTVVLVQGNFALSGQQTAFALAAFGFGSMLTALKLPTLLEKVTERRVMLTGLGLMIVAQLFGTLITGYVTLLIIWFVLGAGCSLVQTPTSKVLVRSASIADRPALFATHFSLSHAGWMMAYPFAGWLLTVLDVNSAFLLLAGLSVIGLALASKLWPVNENSAISHRHDDLEAGHEHLEAFGYGEEHGHLYVIDSLHSKWPR